MRYVTLRKFGNNEDRGCLRLKVAVGLDSRGGRAGENSLRLIRYGRDDATRAAEVTAGGNRGNTSVISPRLVSFTSEKEMLLK